MSAAAQESPSPPTSSDEAESSDPGHEVDVAAEEDATPYDSGEEMKDAILDGLSADDPTASSGEPHENHQALVPTGGRSVSASAISVPDGSATIQGMEESFSGQLSTGIATFSVPFALPSARGDAQPSLGLAYSSSGGFQVAGVGWKLGVPFIARQTDRGIPKYDDRGQWHPEQDRFVFNGGQELVPICVIAEGACDGALPGEVMPVWADGWHYFRARVEGSFLRFFWSPGHETWRVQSKSGVTMELGVPLDGRDDRNGLETNPLDDSEIYRWCLTRQYDTYGDANPATGNPTPANVVVYRYVQNGGMAYLSDIFDTPPPSWSGQDSEFAHHTRIVYEDRTDPTVSYRSGWRIEQNRRVARVDITSHKFAPAASAQRELVRRYHLSYDSSFHPSLLESVQIEGRCAEDKLEGANGRLPESTNCPTLPPMTFEYSHVAGFRGDGMATSPKLSGYEAIDERVSEILDSPDHSLDEELTVLYDINADALPDVLVTAPGFFNGKHGVFFNSVGGTRDTFAADTIGIEGVLGANANTLTLRNLNVVPLDLDGDATSDLLHMPMVKTYSIYSPIERANGWVWKGRAIDNADDLNPKIDFGGDAPEIEVVDVNFDGLVDVVVSTGTEFQTFLSLGRYPGGDGQFGQATRTISGANISTDPIRTCVPWSGTPVRFSDEDTQFADMNGDGIPDIVRVRRGDMRYWPGRGNGYWGTGSRHDCPGSTFGQGRDVAMENSPYFSDLQGTSMRLDDVNGDGLTDLVQVRFDEVDVWLNVDGAGWTERQIVQSTPHSPSFANRVRLTDVNGSGTRDILWGDAGRYKYIDLSGGERPWVLTGVDNGLGKTTTLEYSTSTAEMLEAASSGDPWSTTMPMVAHVVKKVTVSDNLKVAGRPPQQDVTIYSYRDPVYEGRQREFRGFRKASARRVGDANSPADTTETTFLLGECADEAPGDSIDPCSVENRYLDNPREALKGLPVVTEKFDESGTYLSTARTTYRLRELYVGLDGRAVRHAFQSSSATRLYDTGPFKATRGASESVAIVELQLGDSSEPVLEACSPVGAAPAPPPAPGGTPDTFIDVPVRGNQSAVVETRYFVDVFGNRLAAASLGCTAGATCPSGGDEIITAYSMPDRPAGAGPDGKEPTGWLYRTEEECVTGTQHAVVRNHTATEFNEQGDPVDKDAFLAGTLPLLRDVPDPSDPSMVPPRSSDGRIDVSSQLYDDFGNLTREQAPNGRCRSLTYESSFSHLMTTETVFTGGGCGAEPLTTAVVYDRGFELVTLAIDIQGQHTDVAYDGFGRLVELRKPHPTAEGQSSGLASIRVSYFLPPERGLRHSVIHAEAQDSSDHDVEGYLGSFSYVDGFGRTFVTVNEAEGGKWIVAGLSDYDDKSAVRRKYLEHFFDGDPERLGFASDPGVPYASQRYDAFGRQIQTFDLDGTVTLQSVYHALSSDLWDAADLEPGPHQGTPASEARDGHGRTTATLERFKEGSILQTRQTVTQYLPTNEPEKITRLKGSPSDVGITDPVVRWFRYDTIGRMVLNVEPNSSPDFTTDATADDAGLRAWRYTYDDFGDLTGVSDARGCGANFFYDGAGRILMEDYFPCEPHQPPYSPPDGGTGVEVLYEYDHVIGLDSGDPDIADSPFFLGRLVRIRSRASDVAYEYDGRGRIVRDAVRVKKPGAANDLLDDRYAPRWYTRAHDYDALDRPVFGSTGARLVETAGPGLSGVTSTYDARGLLSHVEADAPGDSDVLIDKIVRSADNLVSEVHYGDAAETRTLSTYDNRRRLRTQMTIRAGSLFPDPTGDPTTYQLILQDDELSYDVVNNPVEIRDYRLSEEWPAGAKPVHKRILYDDLYRAAVVNYEYEAGDDEWVSPYDYENNSAPGGGSGGGGGGGPSGPPAPFDSRLALPSPHVDFDARILWQEFRFDWLGNTIRTRDDSGGFYDRSLGDIENGQSGDGPYQLRRANNQGASARDGELRAEYDDCGNLTELYVDRNGECLGDTPSTGCAERFLYEWDELGRLTRATRYDTPDLDIDAPGDPAPVPSADLRYEYNADDQRVTKLSVDSSNKERHTLYLFDSLEVRRAEWINEPRNADDYELSPTTEVPYLLANGVRVARVVFNEDPHPSSQGAGTTHVFLEMGDHLGSTTIVIDKETGELVERTTYQAFGASESDYRPEKWRGFREDYRFTGKEEDVEVGLTYFGKRFYAPLLGRWMNPDPLELHSPGQADGNLYAYVRGQALKNVDPMGLDDDPERVTIRMEPTETGTNYEYTFSDAKVHAKPPRPAVSDEDKIADALGVPRPEVQGGLPTAEAVDRARMALPTGVRDDKSLRPVSDSGGVHGWTTERQGVTRLHSPTGERVGYAGEKPLEGTLSPVDLIGPGAVRGLWTLGGKALQLGETARRGVAQWHFQRTVTTAELRLTEADALALTGVRTTRAALQGERTAYGQIVEAGTGNMLRNSWVGRGLYRPASGNWLAPGRVQGPDGRFVSSPDFTGRGVFKGFQFDATTVGQSAAHRARYPGVIVGVY